MSFTRKKGMTVMAVTLNNLGEMENKIGNVKIFNVI